MENLFVVHIEDLTRSQGQGSVRKCCLIKTKAFVSDQSIEVPNGPVQFNHTSELKLFSLQLADHEPTFS